MAFFGKAMITHTLFSLLKPEYAENFGMMIHTARISRYFYRTPVILYLAIMLIDINELIHVMIKYFKT